VRHREHDRRVRQVDTPDGDVGRRTLGEHPRAGERDGEREGRGVLDLDHGEPAGIGYRPDTLDCVTLGDAQTRLDHRRPLEAALPDRRFGCRQMPAVLGGDEPLQDGVVADVAQWRDIATRRHQGATGGARHAHQRVSGVGGGLRFGADVGHASNSPLRLRCISAASASGAGR
jgi:hypothetical protein